MGEWAGLVHKPLISGTATSPIFAQDNFGYVSRSIPSELYVVEAYTELMAEYDMDLINVVYANDQWGTSVAEALLATAGKGFNVHLIRSIESADDVDGINDILDDLEASPSQITFVSATEIQLSAFLNAAGRRGMHESHLWLSPLAMDVLHELNPLSTGSIWAALRGEELTKDSPFAQRYLAKDPTPHIEAQQYGFGDDYDVLTYYGVYNYDAVLAAAHALVATQNISDGQELLSEIRNLSLNNTNTGVLQMDENGDRIGARVPLFFITSDGKTEKFAVYDGNLEYTQEPLWPGGSTTQPKLIREEASAKR